MAEKDPKRIDGKSSLTDDQIVSEPKLKRRSFLATTGAALFGAAAVVAGVRAVAQDASQAQSSDPDAKKNTSGNQASDPDSQKGTAEAKGTDPDAKKATTGKTKKRRRRKKSSAATSGQAADQGQNPSDPDAKKPPQ
jgi:negative regulator of sigma E activity